MYNYFSRYLPSINVWGKFHFKVCCSPYLLKFSIEIRQTYISQNISINNANNNNMTKSKQLPFLGYQKSDKKIKKRNTKVWI